MKKIITIVALAALLTNSAFALPKKDKADKDSQNQSKEEAKQKKEEEKRLKEELKAYEKNLAGYKAFKEQTQATADSDQAQLARLTRERDKAREHMAEMETKVSNDEAQIQQLQQQQTQQAEADPGKKAEEREEHSSHGTYYKVQLGMYQSFNINKYFEHPRDIGYEVVSGMNRYLIGNFEDEQVAQDFVKDIRKMGIRDAFVAKYIDGTRVFEWSENPKYKGKKVPSTLEEALEMNGDKGGKKRR